MYPYYALFDESRREADENRFWFWNSMHFPVPMPAFDVQCIDAPYQAVGEWQNRFFAVPPAMGIDYRIVNGYVYISGNPVTDPEKIAERVEYFQRRAGYYFEHWEELYAGWKPKMEALIAEITELPVPELPEYEPDALMEESDREHDRRRRSHGVQPHAPLRRPDVAAPLRAPAARLRRVRHVLGLLQERAARHPGAAHRADGRRHRRAPLQAERRAAPPREARDRRRRSTAPSPTGRTPAEIDAELGESDAGRAWLEELERTKDPWFNMATGDGLYHYYRSWYDDPTHPVRLDRRLRPRAQRTARTSSGRRRRSSASATGSPRSTARCSTTTRAATFNELLGLSRMVFPYVEEHKFFCDYWFLTRWWNKLREFGALLARHGFLEDAEDVFNLGRHEVAMALDELLLTWATGGAAARAGALAADRRAAQGAARAARRLDAAAGARRTPECDHRPDDDHALGRHDRARPGLGARGGGREAASSGAAASPGTVEGAARVVITADELATRAGGRHPRLPDHVSGLGADLLERPGRRHRHRRRHVARGDRLPRVRAAGGRRHRPRDGRDRARARRSASTARPASSRSSTRDCRVHPSARRAAADRRGRVRRQEREPRRPARGRDPGAGRVRRQRGRLSRVRRRRRPGRPDRGGAEACGRRRRRGGRRRVEGDRRGDALRAAARGGARRDRRRLRRARRGEPPVAVRSSAIGEDSDEATFAGQQESFLWVRGAEQVCDAVRDCWVSLYTPRAMSYRARLGAADAEPAMGVTVQLMVDAEVSGVLFTCNPVSGDPSMVAVNASWGLGLAVVGGEVTPGRLPRQQGHGRGRAPEDQREARRVRAGRGWSRDGAGRGRGGSAGRALPRRGGARGARRDRRSASSGTSAHTRTSSGRSRESRSLPESLVVLQARPVTARPQASHAAVRARRCRS